MAERTRRNLAIAAVAVAAAVSVAIRWWQVRSEDFAGHGDPSFYFVLADNLANGRGLIVDYVAFFWTDPAGLTHTVPDYWLPLQSIVMAPFLAMFGQDVRVALGLGIALSLGFALLAHLVAREIARHRLTPVLTAVLTLFTPGLIFYSLTVEAVMLHGLLALAALFAVLVGRRRPGAFVAAGALTGLAHLTRNDGVLLLVPLVVGLWLLGPPRFVAKARLFGLALGAYLLVLLPLLLWNLHAFGGILPSGAASSISFTDYEQLYTYAEAPALADYLRDGLGSLASQRVLPAKVNIASVGIVVTPIVALFGVLGVLDAVWRGRERERRLMWAVPVSYAVTAFMFHTVVTPTLGDGPFRKLSLVLVPFLVLAAVDAIAVRVRGTVPLVAGTVAASALLAFFAMRWVDDQQAEADEVQALTEAAVDVAVADAAPGEEVVVMTRDPWEYNELRGCRAVMVPYEEDRDVVVEVARRYGASHLVLPADRPALDSLADDRTADPRLEYVGDAMGQSVFRFADRTAPEPEYADGEPVGCFGTGT